LQCNLERGWDGGSPISPHRKQIQRTGKIGDSIGPV